MVRVLTYKYEDNLDREEKVSTTKGFAPHNSVKAK